MGVAKSYRGGEIYQQTLFKVHYKIHPILKPQRERKNDMQQRQTTRLRELLSSKTFLHMPAVYDALTGRLVQSLGYEAAYVGGYVTGGASTVTEPQLTMTEQVRLAGTSQAS